MCTWAHVARSTCSSSWRSWVRFLATALGFLDTTTCAQKVGVLPNIQHCTKYKSRCKALKTKFIRKNIKRKHLATSYIYIYILWHTFERVAA